MIPELPSFESTNPAKSNTANTSNDTLKDDITNSAGANSMLSKLKDIGTDIIALNQFIVIIELQ